jgi:hypothetical protein
MAAMTLYNNSCGFQTSYELRIIEGQFGKLPRDVQEKALSHEVKGIESVLDTNFQGTLSPGGWPWFCTKMNRDIKGGEADHMFATAREGFFPIN